MSLVDELYTPVSVMYIYYSCILCSRLALSLTGVASSLRPRPFCFLHHSSQAGKISKAEYALSIVKWHTSAQRQHTLDKFLTPLHMPPLYTFSPSSPTPQGQRNLKEDRYTHFYRCSKQDTTARPTKPSTLTRRRQYRNDTPWSQT